MDLDEIREDSGFTDGEMDAEEDWADGDTTFSDADMSIGGEIAALAEDGEVSCRSTMPVCSLSHTRREHC
jgi:hypothetical protein